MEHEYSLNSLYLYLTDRCNLCCDHCWISPTFSRERQPGIPLEPLKRAICEAIPLGLGSVKLTGGEPLLYRYIDQLLSFLAAQELSVIVETNGTLINGEVISLFKSCDMGQISVSLDAATEEIHDEIRGVKGSFQRTLKGMRLLSENDLDFQVIMALQQRNSLEIPGVVRLSRDLGAGSLKINPLIPCGRGRRIFKEHRNLELDELIRLFRMVKEEESRPGDPEIIFDLPPVFRPVQDLMRTNVSECNILNILGILGSGDFSICGIGQTMKELRMGNLSDTGITDVWKNSLILKDLRMSLPWKLKGICGRCIFRFRCLGACRANAYTLSRDFYAPYFLCQEYFDSGKFPGSRYMD